jgi:DHA2 family multidrug resistance protein
MAATIERNERRPDAPSALPAEKLSGNGGSPQASASRPETPKQETTLNPHRWIILFAVLMGAFLELLDTTSVNVALREMQGNLGATSDEIAWVSTGYILSNVVVLPMTAWLASVFGRKRYLTASVLLFTIASIFCGASTNLGELVFWRIMQGAGGAALLSTAQATIREVFPIEQQGMVQALYIVVVVTGPTLGPTFGGWITDNYSWPWIFYAKAPLGFIAAALVSAFLQESAHRVKAPKIDAPGIALLAVGLGSLQYVLEEGERYDWFSDPTIAGLSVTAVVAMVAFVIWELWPKNTSPVVNLRILRNKELTAGTILLFIGGFGIYAGTYILPLLAQSILGLTPTATGLIFLPGGAATIIGTLICGRILNGAKPLVKPVWLIAGGMVVFSIAQWALGHLSAQAGSDDAQVGLIIRGAGLGFLLTPITVASLSTLKGAQIAQGAGLTNLFRQLGGSFGIAFINTYITQQTAYHRVDLVGDVTSASPAALARTAEVAARFGVNGYSHASAHAVGVASLERAVEQQSLMLAFNDAFMLIAAVFLMAVPLVLLYVKGKTPSGPAVTPDH